MSDQMEVYCVSVPGFEAVLLDEVQQAGFSNARIDEIGVSFVGEWDDVWKANIMLRGATRVLVRVGSFRAMHLAQLDKRSRKFPWDIYLRPDVPIRVEATCRKSKIYHDKAAKQRFQKAISETIGCPIADDASVVVKVRIFDDLCTISIDSSGDGLHKRGHKEFVGKAPIRETMAALCLRACGYSGEQPVLDPMCGSGTFLIEAAEIAQGMFAGRERTFAFENLATADASRISYLKSLSPPATQANVQFYGSDRDAGAVKGAMENAERAGVAHLCQFSTHSVSDVVAPDGPAGIVMINPPYGTRISNKKALYALYSSIGKKLRQDFTGWKVGMVTSDPSLVSAMELGQPEQKIPFSHGGLKVALYQFKVT